MSVIVPIARRISFGPPSMPSGIRERSLTAANERIVKNVRDIFSVLGKQTLGQPVCATRRLTLNITREITAAANAARTPDERGQFIENLLEAIDRFDPKTVDHQERVTVLVARISESLALPENERDKIVLASRLHDFGKIGVPQFNFFSHEQYGTLTLEQKQYHLLFSLWLFGEIAWLREIVPILEYMHIFDGYPVGLKHENMNIASQVLSVADFIDALTSSDRPYRKAVTTEIAYKELTQDPKRFYDTRVLSALAKALSLGVSIPPGPAASNEEPISA
jgi:HD-GYP domain-containing protein (c-di-GMP phosphodiesterase class II)